MSDEQQIERLLRLADPGPELPADGEARIKAALRPVWRAEVRRRAMRRRLIGVVSLAAAAVIAFVLLVKIPFRAEPAPAPIPVARVELVRGPVDASLQTSPIVAGAWVRTSPASRAALRLSQGASLRLDCDTAVHLLSAHIVELAHGAIYIDSGGRHAMPIEVRTSFGSVHDVGTRFEVRAGKQLTVLVREGAVAIAARGRLYNVNAGSETSIDADGALQSGTIAGDAGWSASVAPSFATEGKTVAALLDWCSRESGLTLRYHDAETEQLARTTVLHGTANDLEPVEAAQVILPTAGLRADRQKQELVIRRQF